MNWQKLALISGFCLTGILNFKIFIRLLYLIIFSEKDKLQKFTESILRLCIQDFEEKNAQYLVQTGYLSYLVDKAFPGTDFTNDERVKEISFGVIKAFLQEVFTKEDDEIKRFTCLFSLWNAGILETTSLVCFCSFSLDFYFNLNPIVKDLEAFEILENSCTSTSSYMLTVIEKILKVQKMNKIVCVLKSAIHKSQINAKSLFIVVKVFLKTHKESPVFISKMVSELMNEAYENFSHNMLLRSLLIGYQTLSQLNVHYRVWLQTVFRDCGYTKDKHSFSLLIQVLSDFVPFQKNIEHLKAAIDLNFPVPSEVQTVYGDYIALLKTRVQDLKPSTKLDLTVGEALSLFESSGKIPQKVMETSLFQKQKFLNEFLPALLIPRIVPPIPDVRERFIEALFKARKLPDYILQKYKNECVQKQRKIIEDISMIDDNFDDFIDEDNS